MSINFGIPTDCPKCLEDDKRNNASREKAGLPPYTTLNCMCRYEGSPNWELTSSGWAFKHKEMKDFDNVFNYIDWIGETRIGYEMEWWRYEEIMEYIKEILLENHKLEQLLVISSGFPSNFKSIITGQPLWPSEEE